MPGRWGLYLAIVWTGVSLLVALALGPWGFGAAALGLVLAWAYSMPPIRLKENGWWGNLACGLSYEGLAWITGAAVMAGGVFPETRSVVLALLYSLGAHGIMTLNDFKSIKGDAQMGVRSLPVQLGPQRAAFTACMVMAFAQMAVVVLLAFWQMPIHASAVFLLLIGQALLMAWFLKKPIERALYYSGFGVPLFVIGMMVSAFALRSLHGALL
jgi:chlorophyll synthase